MRRMAAMALLDVVLPPACAGCGRFGALLCAGCVASFGSPGDARDRFVVPDPGIVVGEQLAVAMAAFSYEGSLRRVLQRVKYAGAARVTEVIAEAALPAFRTLLTATGPVVVAPVPLHRERERERGFNQAALLATALAARAGLVAQPLLRRERATARQHHLDRAARLRNLAGALRVAPGVVVPEGVVVVDDILTTSATLEACAVVLRSAGCLRVYGFALAREV